MASSTPEPPTLRSFSTSAFSVNRRSYSCYNCNHSFYITPTTEDTSNSPPSSFRCPRCLQRHLIPRHTVYPPTPLPPPPPPPPPPYTSGSTPASGIFTYYTSDEFESDYDYDSDNSILSFTFPNYHIPASAVKSLIDSLPIKTFALNPAVPLQSCSICMEDFGIDPDTCETVVELPCKHCFHKDCVGEWLKRNNTCPMCRYKLSLDPYLDKWDLASVAQTAAVVEYNELLEFHLDQVGVLAIPPAREPVLRRVNAEVSLTAIAEAEASGSNWRALSTNAGERNRWLDPMDDEDGDTLMVTWTHSLSILQELKRI